MTGYKRVNFYELCRLCTSSQQRDKIHIFREEGKKMQLQHKIQTCFPLLVCEHDYLPKVVCTSCIEALDQCFNFRQNCISSESMLSSYFSNFRFTEDFKKAGKVYVKDTGQKDDNRIESIAPVTEKKNNTNNTQESTINSVVLSNMIREGIPQYFTPEPQNIQNKNINKTLSQQKSQNINTYQDISSATINVQISKEINNIPKFQNSQQINIPNSITQINYNTNVGNTINNNKTNFDQTKTYIEHLSTEFTNVLKNNNPPMVVIDMEQLIDTGLHESEVNKLKEALLKPPEFKNKKQKISHSEIKPVCTIDGVKMYKCDDCHKMFKRREHLYQHSKLHTGVRPFSCIHCPKTFSRKEHLMRHLTSHSGVKDYCCDVCSKRFSRPDNLKKHKKTHQKMPYRCEICSKDFVIKHYFSAHMQAHQNGESILENIIKPESVNL